MINSNKNKISLRIETITTVCSASEHDEKDITHTGLYELQPTAASILAPHISGKVVDCKTRIAFIKNMMEQYSKNGEIVSNSTHMPELIELLNREIAFVKSEIEIAKAKLPAGEVEEHWNINRSRPIPEDQIRLEEYAATTPPHKEWFEFFTSLRQEIYEEPRKRDLSIISEQLLDLMLTSKPIKT